MVSERRHDGPTPHDGAYSVVTFLDGPLGIGQPVDEDEATHFVAREYDSEDGLIAETWGTVAPAAAS